MDLDGLARPAGLGYDMGAYEFYPALEGEMEGQSEGQPAEGTPVDGEPPAYLDISVQDAHALWAQGMFFLDVRTNLEYCQGHIPNAVNIPSGELSGRLGELAGREENIMVVYCASGNRSRTASNLLSQNGFAQIRNMLGGFGTWKTQGFEYDLAGCGEEGEPVEGTPTEGFPVEGTPAEGTPAEGQPPLDGETPPDGEIPVDGETPVEGTPLEGETPTDGEPLEGSPPVQGTVQGTVTDLASGAILADTALEVTPGNKKATSDAQGRYSITGLTPDDYFISANKAGYTPAIVAFTIEDSGQVQQIDFRLRMLSVAEGEAEGQTPQEGVAPGDGEKPVQEGETPGSGDPEGTSDTGDTPGSSSGCFGG